MAARGFHISRVTGIAPVMSFADIALCLGMSVRAVEETYARGMKKLRRPGRMAVMRRYLDALESARLEAARETDTAIRARRRKG